LQRIGRDWDSFIFIAGFQSKTGLTPLPVRERERLTEEPTLAELRKEIKSKKKTKTNLKELIKPSVIKETPQSSSKEKIKHQKNAPGSSGVEQVSRVRTRSQLSKEKGKSIAVEESPISKASLNDLLEAIDFEQAKSGQVESMHIDLTQSSPESTKKSKASKRLRFEEPGNEFMFKPRRPVTRRQIKVAEQLHREEVAVKVPTTKVIEQLPKAEEAEEMKRKPYTRRQAREMEKQLPRTEKAKEIKKKDMNKKVPISKETKTTSSKEQWEATEKEMANMEKAVAEIAAMEKEVAKLKAQLNKLAAK
jgi:hypothetical protein